MDVLGHLLTGTPLRATWGPDDDRWYQPISAGTMSEAGYRVDPDSAQKISAWYRGRDILATVVAMLPLPIHRRLPNDGGSEPAVDHPLYDLLHNAPNQGQDSFQWRREKIFNLIDRGWSYDWIIAGARGFVHELIPIDPTLVTPEKIKKGSYRGRYLFHVRDEVTGQTTTHTQDEIFYLRGAGGKGILEYARTSLGTALATESYAAQIFGRGTLNGGVVETPAALNPEAARRLALSLVTKVGEHHLPKVLEQGAKFNRNDMTPEDAQMLLSRKFSIDDMARWLGVPRQMLENSDPSFGNAEQFWQGFLTVGVGGWLSLIEFAVNSQLILAPKTFYAEFTRDAIARGNLKDRWDVHVAAVNAGIKTVDEARAKEGLNKRGGKADELREPQNITGKPAVPTDDPPPPATRRRRGEDEEDESEGRARVIVTGLAARALKKEIKAIRGMASAYADDPAAYASQVTTYYKTHARHLEEDLHLSITQARAYCDGQATQAIEGGMCAVEHWATPEYAAWLTDIALANATA